MESHHESEHDAVDKEQKSENAVELLRTKLRTSVRVVLRIRTKARASRFEQQCFIGFKTTRRSRVFLNPIKHYSNAWFPDRRSRLKSGKIGIKQVGKG